jgi:hypothetical protein
MAVNAGFLITLTLHVQGGLGYSALHSGLVFAPVAVVFGVTGLTWRRWPASWQRALIPGGFLLAALSVTGVGLLLRDGGEGGAWLWLAYLGMGTGIALGFSPTLTRALAGVRPEHAADASGLLATVTQLGQLIGVAAFGALFLSRLTDQLEAQGAPGAHASAQAFLASALALAATALAGAMASVVSGMERRRR